MGLPLTKGDPAPEHDLHPTSQALVPTSLSSGPSRPGATLGTRIEQGGGIVRFPWKLIDSCGTPTLYSVPALPRLRTYI